MAELKVGGASSVGAGVWSRLLTLAVILAVMGGATSSVSAHNITYSMSDWCYCCCCDSCFWSTVSSPLDIPTGPCYNCAQKTPAPVVLAAGTLDETAVDLRLPGVGFDWKQGRSYNSLLSSTASTGPITFQGNGWMAAGVQFSTLCWGGSAGNYHIDYLVDSQHKRTFTASTNTLTVQPYSPPADYAVSLVDYFTYGSNGTSTAGGTTSLTDSKANFKVGGLVGETLWINSLNDWRVITANDKTNIYFSPAFSTSLGAGTAIAFADASC